MISTILGDAIIGSITVIIAIIIFEIIFYFAKINKDIESSTINAIKAIPDITIDLKKYFPEINSDSENDIKSKFSQSIRDLVEVNKDKLKNRRIISIVVLIILLIIFIAITVSISIYLKNVLDFSKLFAFVLLTLLITAVFEVIFYFTIYSKLKKVNNEILLITIYNRLQNN
jgi:ABC-type maltose transport system permease subunit